jgi:hypothetical protein
MKKIGLLCSLLLMSQMVFSVDGRATTSFGPFTFQHRFSMSEKTVAIAVATALVAKILYDVSWHDQYAKSANVWYQLLTHTIESNNINSVGDPEMLKLKNLIEFDDVLQNNLWINNSYNSWLQPWNWTCSQQFAFKQLKIIEILILYADVLAEKETLTSEAVVKAMRSKFIAVSMYPLVYAHERLTDYAQFINSGNLGFCETRIKNLLSEMKSHINDFKNLLRQSKDYTDELSAKRTHELQEQMIAAQRASRGF